MTVGGPMDGWRSRGKARVSMKCGVCQIQYTVSNLGTSCQIHLFLLSIVTLTVLICCNVPRTLADGRETSTCIQISAIIIGATPSYIEPVSVVLHVLGSGWGGGFGIEHSRHLE
jgi:hypothetical protein